MKKLTTSIFALLLFTLPMAVQAQHGHHSAGGNDFKAEFTALIESYLILKDHLVESNRDKAFETAGELNSLLEEIGKHRLEGDDHMAWMQAYDSIESHLDAISNSSGLDELRSHFHPLSNELADAAQHFGVERVVYVQHCPMAFNNEGGSWLSSEEQIANPYLPDTMLRCGRVIERIKS
jgi:membrane fusion protein, copper/silver efflux system